METHLKDLPDHGAGRRPPRPCQEHLEKRNIIRGYHISNVSLPTPRPLPWTSPDMSPSSEPRCRAVGEVGGM